MSPRPSPAPDPTTPAPRRAVVVGMGNVLTGDDAFGPTVVRVLEAGWIVPEDVDVVDAGTPGMDLAGLVAEAGLAIVVDTVAGPEPPGTRKRYDRSALLARPLQPRTNPHAPGLAETLLSLSLVGMAPDRVLLVGVVPEAVEVGRPLSPRVQAAVGPAVAMVVEELTREGFAVAPRPEPKEPDLWWRRSPALAGRR